MDRIVWRISLYLSLGGVIYFLRNPVHSGVNRLGMLVSLFGLLAVLGIWFWKVRPGLVVLPLLGFFPFILPGWELDRDALRESYLQNMRGMEGRRYYWGGESRRGIDCSGLPRLAMREALLGQWWNGRAWRTWAEMWWWDASAKAMSEGYRGLTMETGVAGVLKDLDEERVSPGDLAVTLGGAHVIIYLGDGSWVQADPGPGKVVVSGAKHGESPWFELPVSLHRWTMLGDDAQGAAAVTR